MTYRIESVSTGILLAKGLDVHSPAIRLDEGKLVDKKDPPPKRLKPGASVLVKYPIIGRELVARVTRDPEDAPAEKEWTDEEVRQVRRKGKP